MNSHTLRPGSGPLVVSVPHSGVFVPDQIRERLTPAARGLPDTDWYVDRLVQGSVPETATVLVATHSRMVVDLNRPADNTPLYPGQAGTGLVPQTLFDGTPAWTHPPGAGEIATRVSTVWQPYHQALREALDAARERHGFAILWDAHSIRSRVPRLFEGRLPDLNLGTHSGAACDPTLQTIAAAVLSAKRANNVLFSHVVDGRFRGGHITRHYGRPVDGVHAIQLEMAQSTYLDEGADVPAPWEPERAGALMETLAALADALDGWRPE
jgi:N-formylglutamate deformylase